MAIFFMVTFVLFWLLVIAGAVSLLSAGKRGVERVKARTRKSWDYHVHDGPARVVGQVHRDVEALVQLMGERGYLAPSSKTVLVEDLELAALARKAEQWVDLESQLSVFGVAVRDTDNLNIREDFKERWGGVLVTPSHVITIRRKGILL